MFLFNLDMVRNATDHFQVIIIPDGSAVYGAQVVVADTSDYIVIYLATKNCNN